MSLVNLLTLDGGMVFAHNPTSAASRPGTNQIVVSTNSGGDMEVWDVTTLTSNGSSYTTAGTVGILSLFSNGACAAGLDASSNKVYTVNLNGTAAMSITGDAGSTYTNSNGIPAANLSAVYDSLKYVYFPSDTARTIIRFEWNTWTLSSYTLDGIDTANNITTLCAMPSGNLFVGTSKGVLAEYNPQTLQLLSSMVVPIDPTQITNDDGKIMADFGAVAAVWNNNLVYVYTLNGFVMTIHWPTKTVIHRQSVYAGGTTTNVCTASGVNFYYPPQQNQASLTASDINQMPPRMLDYWFCNSNLIAHGMGVIKNKLWMVHSLSGTVHAEVFSIQASGMPSTTLINSSLLDGTYQTGRVIRVIDPGVGKAYVYTDIPISATVEVSSVLTGSLVYELGLYGTGVNEKVSLSTYNT